MAFYIKVTDTNNIEHTHFVMSHSNILFDFNNSGRFVDSEEILTVGKQEHEIQTLVKELCNHYDWTPEDIGYTKEDYQESLEDASTYELYEQIKDNRDVDRLIKYLEKDGYVVSKEGD